MHDSNACLVAGHLGGTFPVRELSRTFPRSMSFQHANFQFSLCSAQTITSPRSSSTFHSNASVTTMALSSDKSDRASAPLSHSSNRDTSTSWAAGDEEHRTFHCEPHAALDENAKRIAASRSITFDTAIEEEKAKAESSAGRGHAHQSSILEVRWEPDSEQRRKTLRTSQHTTIIYERQRSKSGSHLAAYLEAPHPQPAPHLSSLLSRDTHDRPSPRPKHQVKSKKAIDNLRRDVETDFYEHKDHRGTVRRRSMIRNVSRDDYLLARGANPRTGIVTPGSHSANSSFDESGLLRARGIAPPAKWRQRGDEWISLDFGQATPAPTPPAGKGSFASQGLRTPQRITSGEHKQELSSIPISRGHTTPKASAQTPIATPTGVPGTYPLTPSDVNRTAFAANGVAPRSIPRKPVGSPPSKILDQHPSPMNTVLTADAAADAARSSSAPSATKPIPFAPADVGKHLPPLPSQDGPQLVNDTAALPPDNPFLGQQGPAQSRSDLTFATSRTCGPGLADKELPCPPTNDGRSQSSQQPEQSFPATMQNPKLAVGPQMQSRMFGPRGINQEYPYVRTSRSRMPPDMEMRREHPRGGRPMPIPFYDNPPLHQPRHQQMSIEDPRMLSRAQHPRPDDINDVFDVVHTTTTMNTGMSMSTDETHSKRRPRFHPEPLPAHEIRGEGTTMMNPAPMGHQGYRTMGSNMRANMSIGSISIPVSRNRRRSSSRPQMLGRAEGMHSIPRLRPLQRDINMTTMEPPPLWNTTGMQHRGGTENAGLGSTVLPGTQTQPPISNLQPGGGTWDPGDQQVLSSHDIRHGSLSIQAREPLSRHTGPEDSQKSNPAAGMSTPSGLTRKCSRCHDGFVKDRQRSIDGAIPVSPECRPPAHLSTLQEHVSEVNNSPKAINDEVSTPLRHMETASSSAIDHTSANMDEADSRDHTICCPECCTEQDCHEGCLGHPNPSGSPTRGIRSSTETTGSGYESPPSSKDSDAQSNTSEKVRIGRLAFMKSAFKKSFIGTPHHSRDNSKTSIHSKKTSVAELDTPAIDLTTHPLSPGTFWGGEGTGSGERAAHDTAVEAAKSAIGLKKQASVSSDDAVPAPSPLRVRKMRKRKPEVSEVNRNWTAPITPAMDQVDRLPSPNTSRRVASGPSLGLPTPAGSIDHRSLSGKSNFRNASGASIATIELHVPQFGSLGFGAIWEMVFVPFEASRMWLRHHPQIMSLGGRVLERAYEMAQVMAITASRLWTVIFVYSKTGRLKMKRGDRAGSFMLDCMRSALYLLIFMAIGVAIMRVVKWVLNVVGVLGMVIKGVVWIVKKLLGCGLFW